ncbi:SdpI family protein [Enterococcus pseudoavium]|uniref:SdpI family protein n=2 Tax=Enterococcus pseudoavium TaxID=44007 RepID=UPI0008377E59
MFYFFSALPIMVLLVIFPPLYNYLSKHDTYRTNSVFGFRSTKAVKNPENWRDAQRLCCHTSLILGFIQLLITLVIKLIPSFSDDVALLIAVLFFFFLLISQSIYVNHKLP